MVNTNKTIVGTPSIAIVATLCAASAIDVVHITVIDAVHIADVVIDIEVQCKSVI
jgi:hypothetical protein